MFVVLAQTDEYAAVLESRLFTIHRFSDNAELTVGIGTGFRRDFEACLKTHDAARVIATYIRICERAAAWGASSYKNFKRSLDETVI